MKELSPRSLVRLDNKACAYCHKALDSRNPPEEEHVVGRKFVPKGSLASQWNLIVNACGACNDEKGALENDISAITMRPGIGGPWHDPKLLAEAQRKETAKSARTNKAVRDSAEEFRINGQFMPGVTFSAGLVSGPQLDHERVNRLARFHVAALFYFITYKPAERIGSVTPPFGVVAGVARNDWGNAQLFGFQNLIASWPYRLHGVAADGYFKAVIRRSPEENAPLWAWALEWNRNFRVFGFMGDETAGRAAFARLPILKKMLFERGVDPEKGPYETWGREEVPIAEADDHLFDPPEGLGDGAAQ